MKRILLFTAVLVSVSSLFGQKQVCITIDDLISNGPFIDFSHIQAVNQKIITTANQYQVPAIGFVNEQKLDRDDTKTERIQILKNWVEAGLDLGNHTYSHPSFYKTPLVAFQNEVVKGETITRPLLESYGKELKYFRHPYLNTGPDSLTKVRFENFLEARGYTIAPVTVESSDYLFNQLYAKALIRGDSNEMQNIGKAYVTHTLKMFDWMEDITLQVVGRSIPQIFLCHVNPLNADYLDQVFEALAARQYQFINLDTALEDSVYQRADHYIGAWGVSWVYRWDHENAKTYLQTEPAIDPEIIRKYQNGQ